MHRIHYREVAEDYGPGFELLVNGNPVGHEGGIPYWLIQDDLPRWPYDAESDRRIIAVCPCGEEGCGCIHARVDLGPDSVRWFQFEGDPALEEHSIEFIFSRDEYARVISEIASKARAHQAVEREGRSKRKSFE